MDQGKIPVRVRVGITGHRELADEDLIQQSIDAALGSLRSHLSPDGRTPVVFTLVSSLAEGTDQLAARAVLAEGGDLEVALPFDASDYERTFSSETSRQQFRALYARANWTQRVSHATDAQAFMETGEYVVARVDVLVAVQDPEHVNRVGGTADIVAYARDRRLPMVTVDARTGELSLKLGRGLVPDVIAEFDNYNRPIPAQTFAEAARVQQTRLVSTGEGLPLDQLADRWLPYFVRADLLALKYQARYDRVGTTLFCMAAAAVTSASIVVIFPGAERGWGTAEVVLLLLVLVIFGYGHRERVIQRWLSYRSLAERLRSAFYLAAAGLRGEPERLNTPLSLQNWVVRAVDEVWRELPRVRVSPADVPRTRAFLLSWIRGQIDYHKRSHKTHERAHRRTTACLWAIVIAVTLAAITHTFGGIDHHSSLSKLLSLLTIALPAWGAAVAGSSELKEHRHYGERSASVGASLYAVAMTIERASTPDELTSAVLQADAVLRQDAEGWMGVMSVHDVPLPT